VGTVEYEVTVFVRGDYYRVALLPFGFDAIPQTDQAIFVECLVEDKTSEVYEEEVFERGDHLSGAWSNEAVF